MSNFNGNGFGEVFAPTLVSNAVNNSINPPMVASIVTVGRIGMIDQVPVKNISSTSRPLYRGRLSGSFVYSVGSPPGGGATDIVIVNTGESTY